MGAHPHGVAIDVVLGTRPEAIKLAPVVRALRERGAAARVVLTGQHREMVDALLEPLGLADHVVADLDVMRHGQGLNHLAARVVAAIDDHWERAVPAAVVVQGDTTSAMGAALAAFHRRLVVGHVEAGLRSGRRDDPFPEEMNRRLVTSVASLHFAPTRRALDNLRREGVDLTTALLTGNTAIDSLRWLQKRGLGTSEFARDAPGLKVLVTLHRRESQGEPMRRVAAALASAAARHGLRLLVPMHASETVRAAIEPVLRGRPGVTLVEPLHYVDFVATLADADLVVTDSGGVQEEGPALGTPVLVVRETSERMEAVDAGSAIVAGTDARAVGRLVERLATDDALRARMARPSSVFGDGEASARIADRLFAAVERPPVRRSGHI
ncbi:MAG TPA: UDP-N-acetylglucosamine 2-epimerase (non-hydrolyzing) [Acidimicrobiales bacterium]|nr:UDP-N-acetylglucosamine 2-epimerase (non-hydrolyzing) [Acidimicrobiales bacterium]